MIRTYADRKRTNADIKKLSPTKNSAYAEFLVGPITRCPLRQLLSFCMMDKVWVSFSPERNDSLKPFEHVVTSLF